MCVTESVCVCERECVCESVCERECVCVRESSERASVSRGGRWGGRWAWEPMPEDAPRTHRSNSGWVVRRRTNSVV